MGWSRLRTLGPNRAARHLQRAQNRLDGFLVHFQPRISLANLAAEHFAHQCRVTKDAASHRQRNVRLSWEKPPHDDSGKLREFPARSLQHARGECISISSDENSGK